ncbi:MAG: head-tail adaptor protein [Burkholderiaceae bacterium]|nr:MAG: head-tail adaptor protein [Burkholderiaceae bacterium]
MPTLVKAGSLAQRIDIERRAPGTDACGQPVQAWEWVASRWADVRLLAGLEAIKAGADVSTVRASIRIRWLAGIDAGMRVRHGGATYDITAVLPDPAGACIDLVCETVR